MKRHIYKFSLSYLVDFGLVNFPVKTDTKIIFALETNMNKLSELNAKVIVAGDPEAKIICYEAPHIQYEQIRHDDTFRQYLETALISEKIFRTGIKKTAYQKSYEANTGTSL